MMKVVIAADHAGFKLKESVKEWLKNRNIAFDDIGTFNEDSVDYPDYAKQAIKKILSGEYDKGILLCSSGIGMSIAANRFRGIRAALCFSPEIAKKAIMHNNANILVLASKYLSLSETERILEEWFANSFTEEERHVRRLRKVDSVDDLIFESIIKDVDQEVYSAALKHMNDQESFINLIASENYPSIAVRAAEALFLTTKYAEGYPSRRWYNGCEAADIVENIAIERAKRLYKAEYINVQPHCGSSANLAVYFAILKPGDTILAMKLDHGGHLTHGHSANLSGRLFNVVGYGVSRKNEMLDYSEIQKLAIEVKPKLIVVGASSYPRAIDFSPFAEIAKKVNALLMVDMAHIAGLVAAGIHQNPCEYADFVTSTTHKTLRGPRSGFILCKGKYGEIIDKSVFPGLQGGPMMHTIAAKAICFKEAMEPEFKLYAMNVVRNAKVLAEELLRGGLRVITDGTDNHIVLCDVSSIGLSGREACHILEKAGIIANKNVIPFDIRGPIMASGVRFGTPCVTSRGMKENEMRIIAKFIIRALKSSDSKNLELIRNEIKEFIANFPIR